MHRARVALCRRRLEPSHPRRSSYLAGSVPRPRYVRVRRQIRRIVNRRVARLSRGPRSEQQRHPQRVCGTVLARPQAANSAYHPKDRAGSTMQPVKIAIPGRYWDSFIYKGVLYLWDVDGSVRAIDWKDMILEWPIDPALKLAMRCAFLQSDYLCDESLDLLFYDPEVRELVQSKFLCLAKADLVPSPRALAITEKGKQDNPFPFPHSDLDVYYNRAYVAGPSGVFSGSIGAHTKYPISTRPERKWDAPVRRVSASCDSLAMAAGDDGLFQMSLTGSDFWGLEDADGPLRLAEEPCVDCNWTYWSIFASTPTGGYLASFRRDEKSSERHREFEKLVSSHELWGQDGYCWGVKDKLCLLADALIKVIRYTPWVDQEQMRLIGQLEIDLSFGGVVSASTAPFGIVIELDRAIVVQTSIGDVVSLPGEPSNWRAFPRSKHYFNQLHIFKDDCLEIYSFNHEYLVNDKEKIAGIRRPSANRTYSSHG